MLNDLKEHRIVSIIRGYNTEDTIRIVETLIQAGIKFVEITLNSPNAIETISQVSSKYGKEVSVGAGTVLTVEECNAAIKAGAKYIISPNTNVEVIKRTKENKAFSMPGALTPSEVYEAHQAGADIIKIFPASTFGPSYIKEIMAPLDQVKLLPTGGINQDNIKTFIEMGAVGVGVSSSIVKSNQTVDEAFLSQTKKNAQNLIQALED